jgi:hypothetical protein
MGPAERPCWGGSSAPSFLVPPDLQRGDLPEENGQAEQIQNSSKVVLRTKQDSEWTGEAAQLPQVQHLHCLSDTLEPSPATSSVYAARGSPRWGWEAGQGPPGQGLIRMAALH